MAYLGMEVRQTTWDNNVPHYNSILIVSFLQFIPLFENKFLIICSGV